MPDDAERVLKITPNATGTDSRLKQGGYDTLGVVVFFRGSFA